MTPPSFYTKANRQFNLIILAVTFSRQSCRSVHENATPTGGFDSSIITEPSLENQGTTIAQVSGAGVGKRNWMPRLDSCPGKRHARRGLSFPWLGMRRRRP